jgi:hypothetical protein
MMAILGNQIGATLAPGVFDTERGGTIQIDGVSTDPLVLCEAYAHHGALKAGHKHKVVSDALKLIYVEKLLGSAARKIVLLADEEAAKSLKQGRSWAASAFQALGVEVHVVNIEVALGQAIRDAQIRQRR